MKNKGLKRDKIFYIVLTTIIIFVIAFTVILDKQNIM